MRPRALRLALTGFCWVDKPGNKGRLSVRSAPEYPVVLLMCYRLYGFYRIFFPVSVDKSPGGEGVNVVPNSQRGKRFNR